MNNSIEISLMYTDNGMDLEIRLIRKIYVVAVQQQLLVERDKKTTKYIK